MSQSENPPRLLGALLALLGAALAIGGLSLLRYGEDAYFLVAGLGIAVSGVLIAQGKLLGARVYLCVFVLMVVWSLATVGFKPSELFPRLLMPALLCAYIFSSRVQSGLE